MPKPTVKSFSATLERMRSRLNWTIIHVPFDVKRTWGSAGLFKVKGDINGFAFRTSLFPTKRFAAESSNSAGHILLVNKKMQAGAGVRIGSVARFRLQPDTEERVVALPYELKRALAEDRTLLRWFDQLNHSTRYEICKWVADVKTAEARQRRAEQMALRLFETMEAERELPPLLRVAFARHPLAGRGWDLMSPSHRRAHLLGIFYYRTPESRANRLEKTLQDAIAYTEKKRALPRED
jgi:uncharacterized protein YdeI (YjbR/CyaY-like superfamily)